MKTENLYQPFEVEYKELDECPITAHVHNFFELVYIVEGTGVQCINDNKFHYRPEHFFLLMPQDCHSFEVKTVTKFFFIRFNDIYLKAQKIQNPYGALNDWTRKLEFIFQNTNHLPGCILKNKTDKLLVKALIDAIIREHINQQQYHQELVQQIVNTLITIVARNISFNTPQITKKSVVNEVPLDILHYIHQNIYMPENLKVEQIAAHFNISATYIGEYFKKHTGENIQQYITNYKLKLVETRLQYSDLRMNEIAYELNFTDESHLNRIFKKYKGISPSEFRKQLTKV
ncbi:AraC-type DNA-binding protein [Pseudarcicella hirudinis]|uniref:AraC-type DNA-binding protein n=1 Tax=Pseudarcicella hirudinis TaxID=1079859 RepID=A0A1I5MDP1_9BACT|nr:AraC family transcriptional regulator [Pseudarcicella hirudinis]SFP07702.1 AraC-type DNA-binding protein [Pseudarcicella hirudinis]